METSAAPGRNRKPGIERLNKIITDFFEYPAKKTYEFSEDDVHAFSIDLTLLNGIRKWKENTR